MLSSEQIEALVRRYRELAAEKATIDGEMTEIKNQVDAATEVGFKVNVDGLAVSKRAPNRSFDTRLAIAFLDEAEKAECKETRYNEQKIRDLVTTKGHLEACMIARLEASAVLKLA